MTEMERLSNILPNQNDISLMTYQLSTNNYKHPNRSPEIHITFCLTSTCHLRNTKYGDTVYEQFLSGQAGSVRNLTKCEMDI